MQKVILNGLGVLGLATARTLATSSADAITTDSLKETREDIINKAKAENKPIFYVSAEQYSKMNKPDIAKLEDKFGCIIIPVEEEEIRQIKNSVAHKLSDIPVPDDIMMTSRILTNKIDRISSLIPFIEGNTKGGHHKESPRNAEKKKKSKRRQQKQSRRK